MKVLVACVSSAALLVFVGVSCLFANQEIDVVDDPVDPIPDCEFAHASCNTYGLPGYDGYCCINSDEDIRINPCKKAKSSIKYSQRGSHRCADLVEIVNGVCGSVMVEDCGGDVAIGGCNQIPCDPPAPDPATGTEVK